MAALLAQAGNIVVVSGSDPWRHDRQQARERHVGVDFVEIACSVDGTFLEALQHPSEQDPQHHPWVCVDEPYENRDNPELTFFGGSGSDMKTMEDDVQTVLDFLKDHHMILDDDSCGASSTKENRSHEDSLWDNFFFLVGVFFLHLDVCVVSVVSFTGLVAEEEDHQKPRIVIAPSLPQSSVMTPKMKPLPPPISAMTPKLNSSNQKSIPTGVLSWAIN